MSLVVGHLSPVTKATDPPQTLPMLTPPLCTVCWFAKNKKTKQNQKYKSYQNGGFRNGTHRLHTTVWLQQTA